MSGIDLSALDQGLVNDEIEWLRHRISSSNSVKRCSVERTEEEDYFVVEFNDSKIPNNFFDSYGLEFEECRTCWSDDFWKFFLLGERWIIGVGVPKNGEIGGEYEHHDGN